MASAHNSAKSATRFGSKTCGIFGETPNTIRETFAASTNSIGMGKYLYSCKLINRLDFLYHKQI